MSTNKKQRNAYKKIAAQIQTIREKLPRSNFDPQDQQRIDSALIWQQARLHLMLNRTEKLQRNVKRQSIKGATSTPLIDWTIRKLYGVKNWKAAKSRTAMVRYYD